MTVSFYLPEDEWPEQLATLDPDTSWRYFRKSSRNWVLQAYLRLSRAGYPVAHTSHIPRDGIVVFHAIHKRQVLKKWPRGGNALLVGVRGDKHQIDIADVEIVQNPLRANDTDRFFVPHWPQSGMQPRNTKRGSTIKVIAYMGVAKSLHRGFWSDSWLDSMHSRGLTWINSAPAALATKAAHIAPDQWTDYSEVDIHLAVRNPNRNLYPEKPATKLANSWLAGVPAILGRESAYRAMRRGKLDYLEASDPDEALSCIDYLMANPHIYSQMVSTAATRAVECDFPAVLECWRQLLFEEIVPRRTSLRRRTPLSLRRPANSLHRLAKGKTRR